MSFRTFLLLVVGGVLVAPNLRADSINADEIGAPFGVQPFAGLAVFGGVTTPFFSDLSGLPFTSPGIVDILGNIQAFDDQGLSLSAFQILGVTVTQGAFTTTPPLLPFLLASPTLYASTLNPLNQVLLDPAALNLGFIFDSDSSFRYSYTLQVSGIPDGGFVLYDDVEGAHVPEPAFGLPLVLCGALLVSRKCISRRRTN